MIFSQHIEKETVDYMTAVGLCPICDSNAEIIQSVREINEPYTTMCANEYYKHYQGESGVTYIKKLQKPKTAWS